MIWTPILSDHNDTICTKQSLRKFEMTTPLSNQTSWDTNRTTPFQFQKNLLETTYINKCNIIVTNTRLVSILFRLHAVSSRLLQILWHSNGPEPTVHLLESKSRLSPAGCSCTLRNARSYTCASVWILTETVFERSASVDIIRVSAGVTMTVESKQQTWTKQSLPQRRY